MTDIASGPRRVFTTTVPTMDERGGIFPADVPIYDPLSVTAYCA